MQKTRFFQIGIKMFFVCPLKYDIEIQRNNSLCKCEFLFKHLKLWEVNGAVG